MSQQMMTSPISQERTSLLALTPQEFEAKIIASGEKKFRAKQILDWVYVKKVYDFDEMSNLSKKFREDLKENFRLTLPKIVDKRESADGSAKFLIELYDSKKVEMVLMPHEDTATLCISSQVGCARRCQFCATAQLGLKRNLNTDEIIGEILLAKQHLDGKRLSNIVYMGMGEPLDNYDNVVQSVRIITSPQALGMSSRRITISTCGVVPKIRRLSLENIKVKLAVSLNAAINAKRDVIMPVNKKFPLQDLKKALLDFRRNTAYRITFEYVLIKNFNMGKDDIREIKKFIGDQSCKLNIIAWNEVEGLDYESPSKEDIDEFKEALSSLSCQIIQRDSRGMDIDAACGQLALKTANTTERKR